MFAHQNPNQGDFSVHFLDDGLIFNEDNQEIQKPENNATVLPKKNFVDSNRMVLQEIGARVLNAGQGQIESFSTSADVSSVNSALSLLQDDLQERTQNRLKNPVTTLNASHPCDPAKIATYYTKMQKVVAENPNKQDIHITLWSTEFFILRSLELFFSQSLHSSLVPRQVTLHFAHRRKDGNFEPWQSPIKGTGQPNEFYEATRNAIVGNLVKKENDLAQEADRERNNLFRLSEASLKIWSEILLPLQGKALQFSEQLKSGVFQGNATDDPYVAEMLKLHTLKEQQKMDSLKAILDAHIKEKKERSALAGIILGKIETATTQKELRDMITLLSSDKYRALLHDRTGLGWSFINRTWNGNPISTTFSHLIKAAKCKILDLEARRPVEYEDGQCIAGNSISFLDTSRHWTKWKETKSIYYRNKLHQPATKDKAHQKVLENLERHSQAVKKRHGLS